jgi:hypothetical protein
VRWRGEKGRLGFCLDFILFRSIDKYSLRSFIEAFQGFKLNKQLWKEMTSIPLILHYVTTHQFSTNSPTSFNFVLSLGMLIFEKKLNSRNAYIKERREY